MAKKINRKQLNVIISTYKNVALSAKLKVDKLTKQLEEAQQELAEADNITKVVTGGYASWQLITDTMVETNNIDKISGKPIRKREFHIIPSMFIVTKRNKDGEAIEWEINDGTNDVVNTEATEVTNSVEPTDSVATTNDDLA